MQRTLPLEYVRLVKTQYDRKKSDCFLVECDETATVNKVVAFIENQLQNQNIDKSDTTRTLFSIAMRANQQFNRLTIKPPDDALPALRQEGIIPEPRFR